MAMGPFSGSGSGSGSSKSGSGEKELTQVLTDTGFDLKELQQEISELTGAIVDASQAVRESVGGSSSILSGVEPEGVSSGFADAVRGSDISSVFSRLGEDLSDRLAGPFAGSQFPETGQDNPFDYSTFSDVLTDALEPLLASNDAGSELLDESNPMTETSDVMQKSMAVMSDSVRNFSTEMHQVGTTFALVSRGLIDAIGRIGSAMGQFIELADPAAMWQFTLAFRDLQAVMGRMLLPMFRAFTAQVRELADYMINLSPATREMVVMASLGTALATAIAPLAGLFSMLLKAVSPMRLFMIGLASAFTSFMIMIEGGALTDSLGNLTEAFMSTIQEFVTAFTPLMVALEPAIADVIDAISEIILAWGEMAEPMAELAKVLLPGVVAGLTALAEVLRSMPDGSGVFSGGLLGAVGGPKGIAGWIREQLGLDEWEPPDLTPTDKSSVGAAILPARFGSIEDIGKQNDLAAFQAGRITQTPEERAINEARKENSQKLDQVREVVEKQMDMIKKLFGDLTGF